MLSFVRIMYLYFSCHPLWAWKYASTDPLFENFNKILLMTKKIKSLWCIYEILIAAHYCLWLLANKHLRHDRAEINNTFCTSVKTSTILSIEMEGKKEDTISFLGIRKQ